MITLPARRLLALAAFVSLAGPAWATTVVGTEVISRDEPAAEATASPSDDKSIACGLYLSGVWNFALDPNAVGGPRAYVSGPPSPNDLRINNTAFSCYPTTGTLRLEYWIATNGNQPIAQGYPWIGTRIAVFPPNGTLSQGFSYTNINGNAAYTVPTYGTYWLILVLSMYNPGGCTSADGYCWTDNFTSSQMITIGNNPLTVFTAGAGGGVVTGLVAAPSPYYAIDCPAVVCSASIYGGYNVTLTAAATAGSVFAGWSGGGCSGTGQCIVSMATARTVTATFDVAPPQTYSLSVTRTGTGTGTVTSSPGGVNCGATCSANFNSGTVVTLTANPAAGSLFGGWTGACGGTGTCQVTMSAARSVAATFTQVTIPGRRGDVNADNAADLFWRESAPGAGLSWWTMNGAAATGSNYFVVSSDWQIADVGDLNGDRKADLVWRRASDGATYLWTLNGLSPVGFFDLGILNPAVWSLVGTADISGDGKADVIWRNVDGTVYAWIMNGGTITSQGALGNPGAAWQVIDLADMNGDGKADIVFRNSSTGQAYFWHLDGLAIGSAASPGSLDPAQWQLLAAADFSGDGKADLLWRSSAGDTWVWVTNGAMGAIGNPGASWSVKSVADFSGDGKADIVWRHTDGTTYLWTMNGVVVTAAQAVANPGGTWQVVAP